MLGEFALSSQFSKDRAACLLEPTARGKVCEITHNLLFWKEPLLPFLARVCSFSSVAASGRFNHRQGDDSCLLMSFFNQKRDFSYFRLFYKAANQ